MDNFLDCEERNGRQREALKKKYSILKIDELLEKIDCLEWKIEKLKYPEETKKR